MYVAASAIISIHTIMIRSGLLYVVTQYSKGVHQRLGNCM